MGSLLKLNTDEVEVKVSLPAGVGGISETDVHLGRHIKGDDHRVQCAR